MEFLLDAKFSIPSLIGALVTGTFFGVLLMALLVASREPDRQEDDMPKPNSKTQAELNEMTLAFKKYKIGDSFFVTNFRPSDLADVRKAFTDAGLGVQMKYVRQDSIYLKPGTRVWRKEGPYDREL